MTFFERMPFGRGNARFVGPIVALRPDETFYSWISRIAACFGVMDAKTIGRLLFAGKGPKFYPDLPAGLGDFVRSSGQVDCSLEECAVQLSGYGYYANFIDLDERRELLAAMSDVGSYPPSHLGMSLRHVRIERLRFCPDCHVEMEREYNARWWRRVHQLPSSLMCPDHRTSLIESSVDQAKIANGFWLPSDDNCDSQIRMVESTASPDLRRKLLFLARMGRYYLENVEERNRRDWAEAYILDCRRTELANGKPRAMAAPVHSALMQFWRRFDGGASLPFLEFEQEAWVHSLLLGSTGRTPMEHLLMQAMLATYMNDEAKFEHSTWLD